MKRIILASSSPRRIEMMHEKGFLPEIIPANVNEDIRIDTSCHSTVMYLAYKKASYVDNMVKPNNGIIIAADTIVVFNGKIIGKPSNRDDAFKTLTMLRNTSHHVITGVCIIDNEKKIKTCLYDETKVFFKTYSDEELQSYLSTKEPYDKAGGYAIQGSFSKYIDHIEGDFDNVVGFPWHKISTYII